jgi:hypothetical protein
VSDCDITQNAHAGPNIDAIFYGRLLPAFMLVNHTHRGVVTNRNIITNGYCSEEYPAMMP